MLLMDGFVPSANVTAARMLSTQYTILKCIQSKCHNSPGTIMAYLSLYHLECLMLSIQQHHTSLHTGITGTMPLRLAMSIQILSKNWLPTFQAKLHMRHNCVQLNLIHHRNLKRFAPCQTWLSGKNKKAIRNRHFAQSCLTCPSNTLRNWATRGLNVKTRVWFND